ncbi:Signal transduction histidine kinase [Alteribacillus persepolensis]|uniref:histidine kinase n=1 Tax=Alteribacillus persepolensis TaxID=568899 RepID=A0A1G8CT32_9BACI|nr:HAMP domain-containing sensor histidine kinase [Alteribacillus persepolensis]SDH48665.1 Signal transduction histidine kinase [Alteribacillus persepolensis]
MYESLRTLSTIDFKKEFEKLRSDAELVLSKDGYIISLNKTGEEFFQDSRYFYDYFTPYHGEQALYYINKIREKGMCRDFTLLHRFADKDVYVQYSGVLKNGFILLTGTEMVSPPPALDLDDLLSQFDHAYAIIGPDLDIEQVNDAFSRYLSGEHSHTEKKLNFQFVSEGNEGLIVAARLVRDVLEKQTSLQLEVKNDHSGEWLNLKGIYLQDTNRVLLMIYDLSYERKYTHLLTYQDQMESVSHLSAGVAHELRNPLSVIKGFLQLSALTNSFDKYSQTILSETERMNEIIDNFLSVARKKAKKELLTPKCLLDGVIDIIRSECLMQGIRFHYEVAPVSDKIEVNESSFKQIILNALRNSIEAYPDDSTSNEFTLRSYAEDGHLVIKLSDNGGGIPEDVLMNIGKPFFTTKDKGTGVGIPLCKKIMEEHNGTFDIKSKVNKGTIITLAFPLKKNM